MHSGIRGRERNLQLPSQHLLKEWRDWDVAIGRYGDVHCYLGWVPNPPEGHLPMYAVSAAARSRVDLSEHSFLRLENGNLYLDGFCRGDNQIHKIEDVALVLPASTNCDFGIYSASSHEEIPELSRKVFGATHSEICETLNAFTIVTQGASSYRTFPRVTFSSRRDNICDFLGCFIPSGFPYVAFCESQYVWGHISLIGFYRLLAFACSPSGLGGEKFGFRRQLLEAGAREEVLDSVIHATESNRNPFQVRLL